MFLFISSITFAQPAKDLTVTYIANDGFLISNGGKSILIDALFNQGFGKYNPPSDLISKIENGEVPFDKIDLYLVTHNHGDHFYAPYVNKFLENHTKTLLVSLAEVCDLLKSNDKIKNQLKDISLELGASVETTVNDISLKIFRIKHLGDTTGTRAVNLAFLINLNGIKIFSPGDITMEWDKPLLDKYDLEKEKIDVLFLPYFDRSEVSVNYVNEVIKPKYIIAKHIPPADFETESKKFLSVYPKGIIFEKPMEVKSIK